MAFAPSRRRRSLTRKPATVSLNAMMDMMTIILLFLLKTWSVTGGLFTPAIDNLPYSDTNQEARRTLSLILTSEGLFEEAEVGSGAGPGIGRMVVPSEEFDSGTSVSLPSLESFLAQRRALERDLGKLIPSRALTVQAAEDIPYAWVLKLINASTLADYDQFEFVVERQEGGPMSQRMETFPRALSARPFGDLDRTLIVLFLFFTMIAFPTIWRLKEVSVPEVSRDERERYLRVIYRTAPPSPDVVRLLGEDLSGAGAESIPGVETAPGRETVRERAERRAAQARARDSRRQQRLAAARSTGIFTAAGAQMPSFKEFTGSGALSLSGGSLAGIRAGEMQKIVSAPSAEAIAKLRREGLIGSEAVEEENLLADQLEEVELALQTSEVALTSLPTVRGKASADQARDSAVLRRVIQVELEGLSACYRIQKRKDSGLRGSMDVRLVILPAGEVVRVRLRNSVWSNPALGVRVERCLTDRIGRWVFDPSSGGEVTLEFPLVFK